jgi:hypothetical protein
MLMEIVIHSVFGSKVNTAQGVGANNNAAHPALHAPKPACVNTYCS